MSSLELFFGSVSLQSWMLNGLAHDPFFFSCVFPPSSKAVCAFRLQKFLWPGHLFQVTLFALTHSHWHLLLSWPIMGMLWPNYLLYKGPLIMSLNSTSSPASPHLPSGGHLHGTRDNCSWTMSRMSSLYTQEILNKIREFLHKLNKRRLEVRAHRSLYLHLLRDTMGIQTH